MTRLGWSVVFIFVALAAAGAIWKVRRRHRGKLRMPYYKVNINMTRSGLKSVPDGFRRSEARKHVKLHLVREASQTQPISDRQVPDFLVTDAAVQRFLEIEPPIAAVIPEFQAIVNEIEDTYVAGHFFAAISASCVSIERTLNLARIHLHPFHQKIAKLWGKGASNAWDENIDALKLWGYVDDVFATELKSLYSDVRNRYLHSGQINDMRADAFRAVNDAYALLTIFLGFPKDLFRFTSGIECLNPADPRFQVFYKPNMVDDGTS
jgi:hypothetical protein